MTIPSLPADGASPWGATFRAWGAAVERVALAGKNGALSPSRTDKWRPKLAGVRAGSGFAKVLCVGDSTTWGIGATPGGATPYPAVLSTLLNGEFAPSSLGLAIPPYYAGTTPDTRWTVGTGWSSTTQSWASNAAYVAEAAAAGALTFAPGYRCDTFDVYFVRNASFPTVKVSINGAATVDMPMAGAVGITKQTFTAAASDSPTVSITTPGTAGQAFIVGIDSYLSTTKAVRVGNAGVSNATADKWRTDTGTFKSLESVRAYAPDLSILMLGVNDAALSGGYAAASYASYMAAIITACQVSGDVVLMSPVPSDPTQRSAALQAAYRDELAALATARGCVFVDLMSRWGDYATSNANGYMADGLHPSAAGYADIARAVADMLELV